MMQFYIEKIIFSMLLSIILAGCGRVDNTQNSEGTNNNPQNTQLVLTSDNYADYAQYHFQHQSSLLQKNSQSESLQSYKNRSIPGNPIVTDNHNSFKVETVTPFNKYVQELTLTYNDSTIKLFVKDKMYVTLKLYKSSVLIDEIQKTLHDFTQNGRLMLTEGDVL